MDPLPLPRAAMIAVQALIDGAASFDAESSGPVNRAVLEQALLPIERGVVDDDGVLVPTASDIAGPETLRGADD